MDAKLQEKFEARLKDGFLRKRDRTEAVSERFEETVQELVESAGMRYQRHPEINNKTPDGVIYHETGRTYIEAVCSQGPEEFNDTRGETDLCRLMSPGLIERNLMVMLSYETEKNDEWGFAHTLRATTLEDPVSRAEASSALEQVLSIT